MQSFSDQEKLIEFAASGSALRKILKNAPQTEKK